MRGASQADLGWLTKVNTLHKSIYVYNHSSRSVAKSDMNTVPWPITCLLGRYHTKHMFTPRRTPSVSDIQDDMAHIMYKISWRIPFHKGRQSHIDSSSNDTRLCRVVPMKIKHRACPHLLEPEAKAWLHECKRRITEAALKGASRWMAGGAQHANNFPLIWFAIRSLGRAGSVFLSDKDGGFVVVNTKDMKDIFLNIAQSNLYRVESDRSYEIEVPGYRFRQKRICHPIEAIEESRGIGLRMMAGTEQGSFCARMQLICKTHKEPGNVSFRNIHASPVYALKPLAAWVADQLQTVLCDQPQILSDTAHFVRLIQNKTFPSGSFLVKADIK